MDRKRKLSDTDIGADAARASGCAAAVCPHKSGGSLTLR